MKSAVRAVPILILTAACFLFFVFGYQRRVRVTLPVIGATTVHHAASYDLSPPLAQMRGGGVVAISLRTSPGDPGDDDIDQAPVATAPPASAAAVEQKSQGTRPAALVVESFDGLGVGFDGPQGPAAGRNPSDNSLAAGPDHIVQIVNSRLAIFNKKGKVLYGAVPTNTIFKGFGGPCEERNNGDAVVRYDQLAERWLIVMPIFSKIPDRPDEPYAMCYALSEGGNPMGSYYRYEFRRSLFPDYPRPAVWTNGYYVPSSTGDTVIQKHACVVDRSNMLKGRDATEQCVIVDGVNFLNNSDIDGQALPPTGTPNIVMAAGGSQLNKVMEDDGIYAYQFRVNWDDPAKTSLSAAVKIPVAPYHYLCDGQLTRCVSQPDTAMRLDAQGDKLMQRLIYRNFGDHESIVAVHSVNTSAGGGGVRWYEFRMNDKRAPVLYQQGTYAPDGFFRWMASPAMDRIGSLGIGYSFGGVPNYAGQRFAARLAGDPLGQLTLHETTLAEGAASQTTGNRWEDYTTVTMDPDDCTFWYVGDYLKAGAASYSTRISALRMPGCIQHRVSGVAFFDRNHNGLRDIGEPGLSGAPIAYTGAQNGAFIAGANGAYSLSLPADPAYQSSLTYTISLKASTHPGWGPPPEALNVTVDDIEKSYMDFANVCTVPNTGGAASKYWSGAAGKALLGAHDPAWRTLLNGAFHLELQSYDQFKKWLAAKSLTTELAVTALNVAFGSQDGDVTVNDPVRRDWPTVRALIVRAASDPAAPYLDLFEKLNANKLAVTPSTPAACGGY